MASPPVNFEDLKLERRQGFNCFILRVFFGRLAVALCELAVM